MAKRQGPTLRAQWLGQQLRDLREEANFTLRQAGEVLQRDGSTVSRFETGEFPMRRPDLLALLDFYGVDDRKQREALLALNQETWQKGWWDGYADEVDRKFVDYVWLESRAQEIRTFETILVTGLLQTPGYARAAITAAEPTATDEQVERWLELRLARQKALYREDPLRLSVVLDESVLRREVGGADVMREQLVHLADMARRSNVEVRVLQLSAGAHTGPCGYLHVILLDDPYPQVGYIETLAGAIYVEPPVSERLVAAYARLQEIALGPEETVALIAAAAEDLE
ncbi:helix-turn-helix domain-containing protein [Streptoalloteichus hindustanus]|uniref:Helix-turn-helix domain-containing protein n=1 Tax=Streptoalloteichus hindustanus TaxID=2017 RepID=A0A1M5AM70_STRHI|nr:helix-turn-helix transcriptional regulator [Streptoalloteichus hindustanus]SHF31234.1 Helix-turn-helix domain-containing protein [Streptoalloteichus hindustanus]